MSRYAFLRTRRWVGLALVIVVVMVACVFLGIWQFNRHEARAANNAVINTNYGQPAVPFDELVTDHVDADDAWRPVELSGRYLGEQLVVRNRPVDGVRAGRVLAVLALDDERVVVVDRGWLPLGDGELVLPEYPGGDVALTGRLRESEPPDSRTPPPGQVYRIASDDVVEQAVGAVSLPVVEGYLHAVAEDPAAAQELGAFPRPQTSPGAHLSYAFQWWVFAVGALVGYIVLARREAVEQGGPAPADSGTDGPRPPTKPAPGRRRRRTDAEEEDALIEAQLG